MAERPRMRDAGGRHAVIAVDRARHDAIHITAQDRVDIYYNPGSYTTPTNFSSFISATNSTAWMLVNNVNNLQNISVDKSIPNENIT